MKKIFVILLLGLTFLLGGCNEVSDNNGINTKIEFIAPRYFSQDFIEFLEQQTPDTLPDTAEERIFEWSKYSSVRIFYLSPSDFAFNKENITIFWENWMKASKQDFFGGEQDILSPSYFIFEGQTPRLFYSSQKVDIKFLETQEKTEYDSLIKVNYNYITPEGNFETSIYKNFGLVRVIKAEKNPYIDPYEEKSPHERPKKTTEEKKIIRNNVSEMELDREGNLYLKIDTFEGESRKTNPIDYYLEKNWEKLNFPLGNWKLIALDLYNSVQWDDILFGVYTKDTWDSWSYNYSLFLWDQIIHTINNSTKSYVTSEFEPYHYLYEATFIDGEYIVLSERAYEGLLEKEVTIDDSQIKKIIQQQKQLIEQFYLFLDQQDFEKAYALLNNPRESFEEFVQQWKNYTLIGIESIFSKTIAFAYFGEDLKDGLERASNQNVFRVELFLQDDEGNIWEQGEFLHINDTKHVEYIPQEWYWRHKVNYSNPEFWDMFKKADTLKLYFHLINRKKFEEAHALQHSPSPSVEKLEEMYGNVKKVDIIYAGICQLKLNNNFAEMNHSTYEKDFNDLIFRTLVNIIDYEGTTTYYGNRKIIDGKIQTLSTQKVNYDFSQFNSNIFCWDGMWKPVIYLYPETETQVKVYLPLQGYFTATYPQISEQNTREVIAQPDGTLTNTTDGKEYSYLFWEGIGKDMFDIKEGFVVKRDDTIEFLQDKLAYLGLTPREYNEFIVYWWPLMMKNEWNLISFIGKQYISQAPLFITPQPDSIQRVFMVFKGLEEAIEIKEQILEPFERSGFSVIEWGGSELF